MLSVWGLCRSRYSGCLHALWATIWDCSAFGSNAETRSHQHAQREHQLNMHRTLLPVLSSLSINDLNFLGWKDSTDMLRISEWIALLSSFSSSPSQLLASSTPFSKELYSFTIRCMNHYLRLFSKPETPYLTRYLADQKSSYLTYLQFLSCSYLWTTTSHYYYYTLLPCAQQHSPPAPVQAADKHHSQLFIESTA